MVDFLGAIKAKEEPAASSSVASQSPLLALGCLLAGQKGRKQILIPSSALALKNPCKRKGYNLSLSCLFILPLFIMLTLIQEQVLSTSPN